MHGSCIVYVYTLFLGTSCNVLAMCVRLLVYRKTHSVGVAVCDLLVTILDLFTASNKCTHLR